MNCIQGIYDERYQGVRIKHSRGKQGILSMGTDDDTYLSIVTESGTSVLTTDRLMMNVNHVCIPSWSGSIFPNYVAVDSFGNLVKKTQYGYAFMMAVSVVWCVSRWL